ncbi:hypothetical protein M514_01385 [Trichuris suis]|uniref:ISXO2-like transposase domain-containing protein n=1 Tax=Trichuris suis TaxID=68888 RepID=A0A085NRV2_9BILA|nr:hypothetical protein M513_01385 [Trichuris suis]KFD72198.1 hypothetical protein M514_01385 [Trichuris suis]
MTRDMFDSAAGPLLCDEPLSVILRLQENKLLKPFMDCEACHSSMNWTKHCRGKDGFAWRCQTTNCPRYKATASIRTGSFFAHSNISLKKWMHVIYLWCERVAQKDAAERADVSENTIIHCYSLLRNVCELYFDSNPVRLGGFGITLAVGESCFSHRVRASHKPLFVFGIVDTSTTPSTGYMEIVQARNATTFLSTIQRVVRPGSIIQADDWEAYSSVQQLGYAHRATNSSLNFVEPKGGMHQQAMESYWSRHKSYIKKMRGCKRDLLSSYLKEFMWHDFFCQNAFTSLCHHIAMQHPV